MEKEERWERNEIRDAGRRKKSRREREGAGREKGSHVQVVGSGVKNLELDSCSDRCHEESRVPPFPQREGGCKGQKSKNNSSMDRGSGLQHGTSPPPKPSPGLSILRALLHGILPAIQ